ncbi:MAG: TetR/AcrR family transcriptional regulator [Pseudomonadota bacterium]
MSETTNSMPAATAEPQRGRPRNQQTHEAILDAARTLLGREGEARFSIEQVAASAGVSKASIYRRWPTKGALLIELYMEGLPEVIAEEARSLRGELLRYLLATVERLEEPMWRGILRSLVAEGQYDPMTAALLRERVVAPRRASGLALLRHAEATGQIAHGLDHELILDLLFGPLWYRLLFEHAPVDADFARRLLRQVEPILFGQTPAPAPAASRKKR